MCGREEVELGACGQARKAGELRAGGRLETIDDHCTLLEVFQALLVG